MTWGYQQPPQWGPPGYNYPPPQPPKKGTAVWVWVLMGVFSLVACVAAVAVRTNAPKKAPTTSREKEERQANAKANERKHERAKQLASALNGAAQVVAEDKTCKRLVCQTVKTEDFRAERAVVRANGEQRKITVDTDLSGDDVAEPDDVTPVPGCPVDTWIFSGGPLKNRVMVRNGGGTHIMTTEYLLPSSEHGFGKAETECVYKLLR